MKKLLIVLSFVLLNIVIGFGQSNCASALVLTPGTQQCGTNSFVGDFPDDNSAPNNPCYDFYNDGEYWFSYVGTGGALQLDVTSLSATYSGIYVLDNCPASSPNCISDHSNGSSSADYSITTPSLSLGTTYYIVIANWSSPYQTDFCLDATTLPPCTGVPLAGTATPSPASVCSGDNSTITLSGHTTGIGITYQWQSAPALGGPYTNISGATSTTYLATITADTYFQCITTCSNGGGTNTSSIATVTLNPPSSCYCTSSATSTSDMDIGNVTLGTINNTTACNSLTGSQGNATGTAGMYSDFRGSTVPIPNCEQGVLIPISVTIPECGSPYGHAVYVFIDFNQDGDLVDAGESFTIFPYANPGTHTINANIPIPVTATLGNTLMRILCVESSSFSNPCGTYTWGETEDYIINITVGVTPMSYVSCTTTQLNTSNVGQGSANKEIICMEVVTTGMISPIDATAFRLRTTGTTDALNDIQNAKIWYTGTSSNFATTVQFGATVAVPPVSPTDMDIAGTQTLQPGTNYFWLSYDIQATATVANVVDGQCIFITVDGANRTPTTQNPAGNRPITLPTPVNDDPCGATSLVVNSGSCSYQTANLITTTTASLGIPAPGCGSLGPDIWFTAIVPPSGRLIIDMISSGGPTDMGMAWYSSSTNNCNNIDNLIECDDDDSQNGAMSMICRTGVICTVPGDCAQNGTLTPGMTVYVRVWEFGGDAFGTFDICAYEPDPPGVASTCASAETIASLPFISTNTTCCRQNTYDNTSGCGSLYQDGEDYLYKYTPSVNEVVDITVSGTSSYTGVFVTDNCPSAGGVNCIASQTEIGGNPVVCGVSLNAGTTYYIMVDTDPNPNCTPFNINISSSTSPTCNMSYTVATTTYSWDNFFGTNIVLPVDDRFCDIYIPIAFPLCYDGYEYTGLLVSSNGYLIFDPISCSTNLPTTNAAPNTYSPWSITAAIPNTTNAPRNAILGPWHDIDPAVGGSISYGVLGTAPNRRFIVTWANAPLFGSSCGQLITQQIKLFETTNDIEIHLDRKVSCSAWNSGAAILGLHNYNGTIAVVPAGYNYPTQWSANNEAWKFTYSCPTCITLPVEFISFTGKALSENLNFLEWATATENNNDYFEIQRMMTENEFITIGIVNGAGSSNQIIDYEFADNKLDNKINYYRLKQVDYDGNYKYSRTIVIESKNEIDENNIFVINNPDIDDLIISFNNSQNSKYKINIIDYLGRTLMQKSIQINEDNQLVKFDKSMLSAGIYNIVIQSNNNLITKQIIIPRK